MLSFFASLRSKDSTKMDSSESSWNSHCTTHLPFNPSVILPLTRELQRSHERNHTRPTVRSHEAEEFMKIDFLNEFILHETGNFKTTLPSSSRVFLGHNCKFDVQHYRYKQLFGSKTPSNLVVFGLCLGISKFQRQIPSGNSPDSKCKKSRHPRGPTFHGKKCPGHQWQQNALP